MDKRAMLDLRPPSCRHCVSLLLSRMCPILQDSRYSHGFLFPSEATRVRRNIISYPNNTSANVLGEQPASWTASSVNGATPTAWAHSSVSTFGTRYTPPVPDLSTVESVEALVEGSDMSLLREGSLSPRIFFVTYNSYQRRESDDLRVCLGSSRRSQKSIRKQARRWNHRCSFHQETYVVLGNCNRASRERRVFRVRNAVTTRARCCCNTVIESILAASALICFTHLSLDPGFVPLALYHVHPSH